MDLKIATDGMWGGRYMAENVLNTFQESEGIQLVKEGETLEGYKPATGGGKATQTGIDYQNRIAAWAAVLIFAEQNATLPFNLPADSNFEYLRCETEQPVDDIQIGTSNNGLIFIQAKHSIALQKRHDSELGSTVKQFVRQYKKCREARGERPWEHSLNHESDRLVLVTGIGSPLTIRIHLKSVLNKIRGLLPGQTLEDAATNRTEKEALSTLTDHIQYAWSSEYGVQPTDDEIRNLLLLIWVVTLDVDPEGSNETEAKNLLRSTILRMPNEADAVWNILVQECSNLACIGSGSDRGTLQKLLINKGFDVKAAPSFSEDIKKLSQYSSTTVKQLSELSSISVSGTEVKIIRKSTEALRSAVEKDSIVLVGDPGAGKSGALHDLVIQLQRDQMDVVFIAVDLTDAQSLGELRNEFGISHEILEVLENWPGIKPAFLVIDALDAARSVNSIKTFRSLISAAIRLGDRWRVVASIRKFDLRYNQQLQGLFHGNPPTDFKDHEFDAICHVNIPKLDDDEIKQAESQSPFFAGLLRTVKPELYELLRNPFNLRLMGELLGLNVSVEELSLINKQNELLDRYWITRIIREDGLGDARESVLKKITEIMIKSKSLKMNRSEIADTSTSTIITDLLSSQVIVEWQATTESTPDRYKLAYSHNVIFDYAVSRLLLRIPDNEFIAVIAGDPELIIAIRPSLIFHCKYKWANDSMHLAFWSLVKDVIGSNDIPEIGKIIGLSVAAELATKIEDFESLFIMLGNEDIAIQQIAEKACRHLVGALLSLPDNSYDSLVGEGAGPWAQFLLRLSEFIRKDIAYILRPLLTTLCDRPNLFTIEQVSCIGKAARILYTFAQSNPARDPWLINHAIQAVCRTYRSDIKVGGELIRGLLEEQHMKLYATEEMPTLANEVKNLIRVDPELVEDIYKAIFTFSETSEEITQIGGSRILGLTSTRRQDYEMALYELTESYSEFIKNAPINATRSLIIAIGQYVSEEHSPIGASTDTDFDFDGLKVRLITDHRCIWDDGVYEDDKPHRMLDMLETYLVETTQADDMATIRNEIIKTIAQENKLSVFWKRLIQSGIKEPNTIGLEIKSLAWTKPILNCIDTEIVVGDFIKVIFEHLSSQERAIVETTILSMTDDPVPPNLIEFREQDRNRLLGCIPYEYIELDQTRQIVGELAASKSFPSNESPYKIYEWSSEPYGEDKYLANQGVPIDDESNKLIRSIKKPIEDFTKEYLNKQPSLEVAQSILPDIRQLHEALHDADNIGVHPAQKDFAWGTLAEACELIAWVDDLSSIPETESLIKDILLEAARHPNPISDPEADSQFDEHPSWGKPAPRIDAAKGLMRMANSHFCISDGLLDSIKSLAYDKVPAVRYQVATRLAVLYNTASDVMWEIIEDLCENEQSNGVLQGLLNGTFRRIAGANPDYIANLTKGIFLRTNNRLGTKSVRKSCVDIFTGLYLHQDVKLCKDIIDTMLETPREFLSELYHLIGSTRELFTLGSVDSKMEEEKAVRKRAFTICERIINSVMNEIKAIDGSKFQTGVSLSQEEVEEFKELARIIDHIGAEIYFGSGAYDEGHGQEKEDRKILTDDEKRRFLSEANDLLNCLSDIGMFPNLTHHLLETLEAYISLDPADIFMKIGKIVNVAQAGGYQYESLAADLIVKIIERYLAEYNWVFRESPPCQHTLFEVLDIFVIAGWPSARRLTYRLEEIYR